MQGISGPSARGGRCPPPHQRSRYRDQPCLFTRWRHYCVQRRIRRQYRRLHRSGHWGVPKRLTWHPAADTVLGWTPDGKKILFASGRESHAGFPQLYTMDTNGSFPEKLPLPWGWEAAWSPDGARLAYVPMRRAFTAWKHYRGGDTTPIWLATLSDSKIEKVPRENSNDYNPMWIGGKV